MDGHVKRIGEESYSSVSKYIETAVDGCSYFQSPSFVYYDNKKYFAVDEKLGTMIITEDLDSYFVCLENGILRRLITDEYSYEYIRDEEGNYKISKQKLNDSSYINIVHYLSYEEGFLIGFSNSNPDGTYCEVYDTLSHCDIKAYLNFITEKIPTDITAISNDKTLNFYLRDDKTYISDRIPKIFAKFIVGLNYQEMKESCQSCGFDTEMPIELLEELVADNSQNEFVKVAKIYQKSLN